MEDPHTKHIVETLAFFIARSQIHGEQTILNLYRRLFRQYFPYFWSPLPSMGLIQLQPSRNLSETIVCKEGTEILTRTRDKRRVYFQTTEPVRVLPIHYSKSQFIAKKKEPARFILKFKSMTEFKEEIGTFRLFVNCLNDFPSSWSLSIALRQHLRSIRILYDKTEGLGEPCEFTFNHSNQKTLFKHPIEQLRSLIHFPEQELFLDIEVPPYREKWKTFTLCFDLGNDWPEEFPLSEESFYPFVVPMVNLQKTTAEIIRCDGTQDSYPILHPTSEKDFAIHSFQGLYSLDNHKPVPLKPHFLSSGDESYEIEPIFSEGQPPEYRLQVNLEDALQKTKLITIEALWYQPWFDKLDHDVKAVLSSKILKEYSLRLVGHMTSPEDRTSTYDIKLLTRLLSLKNQTRLDLKDLLFLFNILKINEKSHFKEIPKQIIDLKVSQRYGSLSTGVTHEYSFLLEKLNRKNQDLVLLYFRNLKVFLDLWMSNIDVEVTVSAPNFKEPITIKEGSSHETSALVRDLLLL